MNKGGARYDRRWYLELLLDATEELFGPFGYTKERIKIENLASTKQAKI